MESECLVNVKSSNINAIGYDEGKGVLEVWFKNSKCMVRATPSLYETS